MSEIPRLASDITAAWLKQAIGAYFPRASFAGLCCQRIGQDFGFASHIYRLSWQDDQASAVVVKLWQFEAHLGAQEVAFYRQIEQPVPFLPLCYHTDYNQQRAVLVLEDLSYCQQGDVLQALPYDLAALLVEALVALQMFPIHDQTAWPRVHLWQWDAAWIASRRHLFLERFPDALGPLARSLLTRLEVVPAIVNQRLAAASEVLVHGDFHLDNVLFAKEHVYILDWSRPQLGPAVLNLAQLLFALDTFEDIDPVLEYYRTVWQRSHGVDMSAAALNHALGGAVLRLFTQSTCAVARWQPSQPRGEQVLQASIAKVNDLLEVWQQRDPELFMIFAA